MSVKSVFERIRNWGKSSLLTQAARIAVVVSIFCIILFLVIPRRTYFSANIVTNKIDTDPCSIGKVDMDCSDIKIFIDADSGSILFDDTVFEINGKQYDFTGKGDSWSLILEPVQLYNQISIIPLEDTVHCYKSSIQGHMTLKQEQLFQKDYISNEHVENNEVFNLGIYGDHLYYSGKLRLILEDFRVQVEAGDAVKEYFDDNKIVIDFPQKVKNLRITTSGYKEYAFPQRNQFVNPRINEIEVMNPYNSSLYGSGEVNTHYNPESLQYPVVKQELKIQSTYNTFSSVISSDRKGQYNVYCSGYADSIVLSNNSLIPTFLNYIKQNAYVVPTMFVTIIVGAISLIKVNEDKKKKEEKADSK